MMRRPRVSSVRLALAVGAALHASAWPVSSAPASPATGALYRLGWYRAAPGRLLELQSALRTSLAATPRASLWRHSQGDQWDLMTVLPVLRRDEEPPAPPSDLVAWQEDEFVRGPAVEALEALREAKLVHVEMFVALADKRALLVREREMENAYLATLSRPTNLVFVRDLGAAWDVITIGAYRGWKHFAERDDIPAERSRAAALRAGFEGDDRIGPYLRSLIQWHHDTLAVPAP